MGLKPHRLVLQRNASAAIDCLQAGVAELVDARDSKSRSARSVGSIPSTGTSLRCFTTRSPDEAQANAPAIPIASPGRSAACNGALLNRGRKKLRRLIRQARKDRRSAVSQRVKDARERAFFHAAPRPGTFESLRLPMRRSNEKTEVNSSHHMWLLGYIF